MNTVEGLGPAAGPQPLTSVLLRRADRGPARPRGTSRAGPGAAAPAVWGNGSATARFRTGASGHPGPGDWWQVMKPSNRFSIASSDGSPPMACHRVHLLAKDSRTRKASDMELTTKKAVPPRTSHGGAPRSDDAAPGPQNPPPAGTPGWRRRRVAAARGEQTSRRVLPHTDDFRVSPTLPGRGTDGLLRNASPPVRVPLFAHPHPSCATPAGRAPDRPDRPPRIRLGPPAADA